MDKAQRKEWNRLDNGLRELDIDPPKNLSDSELIDWARNELIGIATGDGIEPRDRIAAHRALLSSGHAGLELQERRDARKEASSVGAQTPIESLPRAEQIATIAQAKRQIEALEQRLGLIGLESTKTLSAGQPGHLESISERDHEKDE